MCIESHANVNPKATVADVVPGDRVYISEKNGITATGTVAQITDSYIIVEQGRFLDSAYSSKVVDYSVFKEMTEFVFKRSIIRDIMIIG